MTPTRGCDLNTVDAYQVAVESGDYLVDDLQGRAIAQFGHSILDDLFHGEVLQATELLM